MPDASQPVPNGTDELVVGVFEDPWQRNTADRGRSIKDLYRRAMRQRANPRTREYMYRLFREQWPGGEIIPLSGDDYLERLRSADTIVLLYPDAIGQGFSELESEIDANKKAWASVRVLNGRRRGFVLSRAVRRSLRYRRFLERFMIGEVIATAGFLAATPWFLLSDLLRGKR